MKRLWIALLMIILVAGVTEAQQCVLLESTATSVQLGPFLDNTDGDTEETGLTITQADIRLSKNGADFAQANDANGAAHDENGFYTINANTTDTDTPGTLEIFVHESGALYVKKYCEVVGAIEYNSRYSGTYLRTVSVDNCVVSGAVTVTGVVDSNIVSWSGTGVASPDTAGYPVATIKDGTGTGEINTASGEVTFNNTTINTAANVVLVATTTTNTDMVTEPPTAAQNRAEMDSNSTQLAAIVADTSETQGKLPTNKIMGSSDVTDKDDDIDAILVDTGTTLPATLAVIDNELGSLTNNLAIANSNITTQNNGVNVTEFNGIASSAELAAISFNSIYSGQAVTGTLSTTQFTSNLTGLANNDSAIGRLIFWDKTSTLVGEFTRVTDYVKATGLFTVVEMTAAPVNTDKFELR